MLTEKEKMLSSQLYQAFDEELVLERETAKKMIFQYNHLEPEKESERQEILKKLLGKSGDQIHIEAPFRCDYGCNIEIGSHFFANYNFVVLDCAKVKIGSHVFIGPNVGIYTATHPLDAATRNQEFEFALPIEVGDSVWIGGHVVINPGVKIGENTVIGSGSVVTKDIPPNVVAAGNPCKVIKNI